MEVCRFVALAITSLYTRFLSSDEASRMNFEKAVSDLRTLSVKK